MLDKLASLFAWAWSQRVPLHKRTGIEGGRERERVRGREEGPVDKQQSQGLTSVVQGMLDRLASLFAWAWSRRAFLHSSNAWLGDISPC